MHFSDKDLQKQREEIARLNGELAALNDRFDAQKKALGIRGNEDLSLGNRPMPPELKAAMDAALQKAEKAGREAAAALRELCQPESAQAVINTRTSLRSRGIPI